MINETIQNLECLFDNLLDMFRAELIAGNKSTDICSHFIHESQEEFDKLKIRDETIERKLNECIKTWKR